MKKFLYLTCAAVLALWACEKDPVSTDPVDDAPKDMTLSSDSFEVVQAGGNLSLTVTAPSRPKIGVIPSWITLTDGTYVNYKITYSLTVEENKAYETREASFTITSGSLSKTVKVTQAAAEKPVDPTPTPTPSGEITKTLATENPTDRVQALYDYLYGLYGKKIVSGVIANVNWNHEEADKIAAATGKYPAMNCYDFIHILYSSPSGWINYSNLTPVTEWADAGGIVGLMWHFNVPKSESAGTSDVTCTPSETTFRAKNVFTSGSWENKWFYDQMDKVAEVILALQEKGIAAIWRPFHEGAGNATLKSGASWGTAWFWWGYDGADVYKKLWTTMFDYFASKGIRNLIWVWTTQNYNGDSSQYNQDADWYPGDGYVDIVGRDLYGYTAAQNNTEFTQIQAAYPTKMVALAECGSNGTTAFCDISSLWTAGAQWSWFMPWYGDCMPDTSWWKSALSQGYVVTRDQVNY